MGGDNGANNSAEAPQPPSVKRQRRGIFPPELVEIVSPSLKVGALTGTLGLFTGVTAGIVRDASPALFGIVAGFQWFTLGSTYWLTRSATLRSWTTGNYVPSDSDKTKASGLSGCVAGSVGGLIRGPRNIIPAAIVFTLVGGTGQAIVNRFDRAEQGPSEKRSMFDSKWSPLKKLSDDEYRDYMGNKMLKLDVEIALIDDKIAELEASKKKTSVENVVQNPDSPSQ